ncbi:hypothetical protein ACFLQO_01075 [Candidatus Aenigmatarchaeota archaeon]
MIGSAEETETNTEMARTYTENIRSEAELFAMRAFYKRGSLTENEVKDFFRKLNMIIRSIRSFK